MIILSGALVVLAIALLIAGILFGNSGSEFLGLDGLMMIYVSISVSIVSALCLAIGVYLRRRELFGKVETGGAATPDKKTSKKTRKGAGQPPAADPVADDAFTAPVPAVDVPADALVHVVRGRKRYHLDSCRQLAGRDKEELTYAEAKEEGFSPCTACMPDTALAARAAGSEPATAASAAASRGDWAARRAGGVGRELFAPRPSAPAGEGDEAPAPASASTDTTDLPAEAEEDESSTDATATAQFASVPPAVTAEPDAPAAEDHETPDHQAEAADAGDGPQVRILSGTKRYHRAECALIEDIGDDADDLEALTRAEAQARGCTPCLVCQPDLEHSRD